jgi:anti-anti-sigma regulatory factor
VTTLLSPPADQLTELPRQAPPQALAEVVTRPAAPATRTRPSALALTGTLSASDVHWLEPKLEELVATGARTVEVDLSGVQAMHASVARLLLRTSWHLGDPSRALLLLHPQRQVRRVLRFYGAGGLVVR